MERFLYTFFIALSNNFDNIGARIAYSIRGVHISLPVNLWISAITFGISFGAAFAGTEAAGLISRTAASLIAMALLSAIGIWMIAGPHLKKRNGNNGACAPAGPKGKGARRVLLEPESADLDNSKHIDFREGTLLGVALSMNNIGGGVGAGMMGLNSFLVGALSAALSFLALWAGNYASAFFVNRGLSRKASFAAGLLLIAIGIKQAV